MYFDLGLLIFVAPALLLGFWAQWKVKSAYARTQRIPARMSGYAAARHILDAEGLYDVDIKQVSGHLSDHYDPRAKVLRLSPDVYHNRSMAAVGIAAHEAGHAIQDARHYSPLVIRNMAVPVAGFGSGIGILLCMLGAAMIGVAFGKYMLLAGIVLFSSVVIFQLVNLPVEFDASARAKTLLVSTGVISGDELPWVRKVLSAAAMTYVAATLQAVLTLLYYILHFLGSARDE